MTLKSLGFTQPKEQEPFQKTYLETQFLSENSLCGVKEFGNPDPLYTKSKAHAKEEEMPKDERRKPKLPRNIAKDNPVLGQPR